MMARYKIGYYCPRGEGHLELMSDPEYDTMCGSKGWDVFIDAEYDDADLPVGEFSGGK